MGQQEQGSFLCHKWRDFTFIFVKNGVKFVSISTMVQVDPAAGRLDYLGFALVYYALWSLVMEAGTKYTRCDSQEGPPAGLPEDLGWCLQTLCVYQRGGRWGAWVLGQRNTAQSPGGSCST